MTPWLSWPEIQRLAVSVAAGDQLARDEFRRHLLAIRTSGIPGIFPGLDDLVALLANTQESERLSEAAPGVAFRVRALSVRELAKVYLLLRRDPCRGIERLVRRGCRGYRGLRDAHGADLPYRFAARPDGHVELDDLSFETCAASGAAWVLAQAILMYSISEFKETKHG